MMLLGRHCKGQPGLLRWELVSRAACCVLGILGGFLLAIARHAMTSGTCLHGQLLGSWLLGTALLGLLPTAGRLGVRLGHSGWLALRMLLIVGLFAAAFSTTGLLEQASEDVSTHCLLAEAAVRIRHLEDKVTALKHDELITQLFFRMNEMDDILEEVHHGVDSHAKVHSQHLHQQYKDRDYIRTRVAKLRQHAESVAAAIAAEASVLRSKQQLSAAIPGSSERVMHHEADAYQHATTQRSLAALEQRLEGVHQVLAYMDAKDSGEGELSYEEYEIILDALTSTSGFEFGFAVPPSAVISGPEHMAKLKAAFERHRQGVHPPADDPRLHQLRGITERQDRARQNFEAQFMTSLDTHGGPTQPQLFYQSLSTARLESLPGHCLHDTGVHAKLRTTAALSLIMEAAAGFAALMTVAQHFTAVMRRFD